MSYVIFTLLTLSLVSVFFRNKKTFLIVILMLGAVPYVVLMPKLMIGGTNAQASLLLVLFILLSIAAIINIQRIFKTIEKSYLFFLFITLSLVSLIWTSAFGEGLGMTIKYATPILMVVLILSVVKSHKDLLKCEKAIIISGIILMLLGIANLLTGNAYGDEEEWAGKFILLAPSMSPAPYSFLLAMCTLLSLSNYLQTKRVVWLIFFLAFYVGVTLAFVRISMAALLFASVILYGVWKRSILISVVAPILATFIAIAAVVFIKPLRDRMFFSGHNIDLSVVFSDFKLFLSYINTSGRSALWNSVFEHFKSINIYLGAGSGSVDSWVKHNTGAVALHCEFFRLYLDLGLIGLTLFLLSHMQLIKMASSKPRNKENIHLHLKYKALSVGAMVFYMITLFTDNTFNYVADIGMYLFAFLGFSLFVGLSPKPLMGDKSAMPNREKNNILTSPKKYSFKIIQ